MKTRALYGVEQVTDPRIARAARGDREAAQAILKANLPRIRNLIRYLIRGDEDVDDIAQQTLMAVVKGLPKYRGEGAFRSWVDRITARETFAYLKKHKRELDARANLTTLTDLSLIHEDAQPNYLARRELVARLDRLPDEQRHAIVLHHMLGMSVPEVAKTTSVSFDTAKSRLRIGMKKLRHEAKEEIA